MLSAAKKECNDGRNQRKKYMDCNITPLLIEEAKESSRLLFAKVDQVKIKSHFTTSLIIPAYNEEKRIESFLTSLKDRIDVFDQIIVVCDGTDKTAEVARSIDDNFIVLEYEKKMGKGGAILEGFRHANGDIIGYVDADGSVGVNDIIKVFHSVELGSPVAIASRWLRGSRIVKKQPLLRIILGRFYHYLSFAILGLEYKDTQCGLKAYERDVLSVIMKELRLTNLSFDTAFLYHCKLIGYRVSEIPVTWTDTEGSKYRPIRASLLMFGTLIALKLAHSKRARLWKNILEIGNKMIGSF